MRKRKKRLQIIEEHFVLIITGEGLEDDKLPHQMMYGPLPEDRAMV